MGTSCRKGNVEMSNVDIVKCEIKFYRVGRVVQCGGLNVAVERRKMTEMRFLTVVDISFEPDSFLFEPACMPCELAGRVGHRNVLQSMSSNI